MNRGADPAVGPGEGAESAPDPLLALQRGDSEPFERLVQSHASTLIAYFRQRGASPGRSEDLAQEVFLRLYRVAPRYRAEERFQAFLFRVARNAWIDDCRRGARDPGHAPEHAREAEPAGGAEPWVAAQDGEERARLRELLLALSERHRAVFELAVLGELGYPEIAELLGIPVGTVKSRMFHAVRRVREAWLARETREGGA